MLDKEDTEAVKKQQEADLKRAKEIDKITEDLIGSLEPIKKMDEVLEQYGIKPEKRDYVEREEDYELKKLYEDE